MANKVEDILDDYNNVTGEVEDILYDDKKMTKNVDSHSHKLTCEQENSNYFIDNTMENLEKIFMTRLKNNNFDGHKSMTTEKDLKYFVGAREVQECVQGQGEIDLHTHLANCEKNPGHTNFIPLHKLSIKHFPSDYYNILFHLTKALADVTVRIAVNFTSLRRPEFVPDTKDPYPCYNTRGQNSLKTGTGVVCSVFKYTEGIKWLTYRTCPCPECDHSDTPSKVWWEVEVRTARHVVFDESEARQSSCRLWFDDEKSPVVKIYGWRVVLSDTEKDCCKLHCVTHDLDVGKKLMSMVRLWDELCSRASFYYDRCNEIDKLTIIVSHPHGCSKQVSVGHWVDRKEVRGGTRYTYTTCTCPGSSGALVYRKGLWSTYSSQHPHSGVNCDGLSFSGVGKDSDGRWLF